MPPLHKPMKNDGPTCRVCGCSEHNACVVEGDFDMNACSWARTRGADAGPLCTFCSGTTADLAETLGRISMAVRGKPNPNMAGIVIVLAGAAKRRYLDRQQAAELSREKIRKAKPRKRA